MKATVRVMDDPIASDTTSVRILSKGTAAPFDLTCNSGYPFDT